MIVQTRTFVRVHFLPNVTHRTSAKSESDAFYHFTHELGRFLVEVVFRFQQLHVTLHMQVISSFFVFFCG